MGDNENKGGKNEEKKETQEPKQEKIWFGLNAKRVALLFLLGFLVGTIVKSQASKSMTMGFDDYKLKNLESDYNLVAPEPAPTQSAENEAPVVEEGEKQEQDEGVRVIQ